MVKLKLNSSNFWPNGTIMEKNIIKMIENLIFISVIRMKDTIVKTTIAGCIDVTVKLPVSDSILEDIFKYMISFRETMLQ